VQNGVFATFSIGVRGREGGWAIFAWKKLLC